jgi:ribonuclease P protein component
MPVAKRSAEGPLVFPRQERLKGRDEIREVFNRKRVVSCSGAKLFILKNGLPYNRIAFTFSRKFGNAVKRNRARRLGREAYRHLRQTLKPGYDLVLLVYPAGNLSPAGLGRKVYEGNGQLGPQRPGHDDFSFRMKQLRELLCRAGLFNRIAK